MAIIVEDGTLVPNANSFVTEAEFRAYAEERGVTLPPVIEPLLITAMDYLMMQAFNGEALGELPYPRLKSFINKTSVADNVVPTGIKRAQMALALVAVDTPLLPVAAANAAGRLIERTVGPLTTRWASPGASEALANNGPKMPHITAMLAPFLARSGYLEVVRV